MKRLLLLLSILTVILLSSCTINQPYVELVPGMDQINLGEEHILEDCILHIGDDQYIMDVKANPVVTLRIDEFYVRYEYTLDEVTYRCERLVVVADLESPTIALNSGLDTLEQGSTWVDAGVTVTDNVSETESITIEVEGTVNTDVIGTYTIKYIATDEADNIQVAYRVVTIQ